MEALQERHFSIVASYYGFFVQGSSHHIVLEYADEGNLDQYLQANDPPTQKYDIEELWQDFFSLAYMLRSLHEKIKSGQTVSIG